MTEATTNSSEAPASTPSIDASTAPAGTVGASLYPEGGAPSAATEVAPEAQPRPALDEHAQPSTDADPAPAKEGETPAGDPTPLTPESYTLTLPETFEALPELMADAAKAFAEVGVDPAKAQTLMDLYAKTITDAQAAVQTQFEATQAAWKAEVESMPEFKGATKDTSLATIARVFDDYGSPEAREAFNDPMIGNNPAVVKMILSMANALNEGTQTPQGRPTGTNGRAGPRSLGERLYPTTPQ